MPIYEYEPVSGDCKACGGRFELRRTVDRPALTQCPLCRKDVRKVLSTVNTPCVSKPLSVSDARKAGFSVFAKRDKGVYERL